ncbi:MAG: carboxylesterase family protein [Acidobacteria bacterium]|nr:carboxylesterase family protein [Acidobacteriota bacterium]
MIAPLALLVIAATNPGTRVDTPLGPLEGELNSGVRIFRGVPYAQPPVGELRFAPPAPATKWAGVRQAKQFGNQCMQLPLFGDMNFRSSGMSEDCLFLNIWAPTSAKNQKLPVLVYFFGGGFQAGDGSEPRYDGEAMARKGIVSVTINYRLGIFGFLAHPGITAASQQKASGNWGLLDQSAALHWVKANIGSFGGDPNHIVIAGESAGSSSSSAQMASPLSRDLIYAAIGESGSTLSANSRTTLAQAEAIGEKFAACLNLNSIADLRAIPAKQLLEAVGKPGAPRFNVITDGYFFPEPPAKIFADGKQAHVPLLAGWNSEEQNVRSIMGRDPHTVANFKANVEKLYKEQADEILKAYPVNKDEDVEAVATQLAGDRFTGLSTWRWIENAAKTGGKPVYRYYYTRPRPKRTPAFANATPGLAGGIIRSDAPPPPRPKGAVHSAEIEYALGNLATNKVYAWEPADFETSKQMLEYFANFIKTGNPNGKGLPKWPEVKTGHFMQIDAKPVTQKDTTRARYELLDRLN